APIHAVPTAPCPFHQAYDVDARGHALLPACAAGRSVARKSFVVLSSAVTAWLAERERTVPDPPVFADGCTPAVAGVAPVMITPADGEVVTLLPGVRQVVALSASTRSATVSWFVDGSLLGTVPASERVFWTPAPGKHDIVVADDAG